MAFPHPCARPHPHPRVPVVIERPGVTLECDSFGGGTGSRGAVRLESDGVGGGTRRSRRASWLAAVVVAAVLGAGCSDDGSAPDPQGDGGAASTTIDAGPGNPTAPAVRVPGDDWETVDPAAVGLDPQLLDALAAAAEAARSTCLVVVRDGRIAGEWYFDGAGRSTTRPVWSVTKSIVSTLVGIAQDDGALTIDQSASTWVPQWAGTPAEQVTVRNLLANDSGREWSLALDYGQLLRSDDQTTFAVDLAQPDPPGEVWAYNNAAIQTLDPVLRDAIGDEVATFAEDRLFAPLGMDDTTMGRDPAGNTLTYAWTTSTCRDLARFGLLMLADGRWGDEQIVSPEWVEAATGAPSTGLNAGYGYLWWLNHEGVQGNAMGVTTATQAADPALPRRQIVPGAPADVYWARGFGNQIVQVHPATDTVLVRLSADTDQTRPPVFGVDESTRLITEGVVGPPPTR